MPEVFEIPKAELQRRTLLKQLSGVLVLLLLVVAAQGWQIFRGMQVRSQSWEYIIDAPTDEQLAVRLKALGSAGWELVSARRATTDRSGKTEGIYEMIFRRPAEISSAAVALPIPPQ